MDTETPADVAEEIAEAVSAPVADAIADVIEAQETHAENAELIAEAALEGARGQRIEHIETELAACQTHLMNLAATLETLPGMLATETLSLMEGLNSRLSAAEGALESLTAAAVSQSTPPPLAETMMEAPAEIVEPEAAEVQEAQSEGAHVPAPKRFRSI